MAAKPRRPARAASYETGRGFAGLVFGIVGMLIALILVVGFFVAGIFQGWIPFVAFFGAILGVIALAYGSGASRGYDAAAVNRTLRYTGLGFGLLALCVSVAAFGGFYYALQTAFGRIGDFSDDAVRPPPKASALDASQTTPMPRSSGRIVEGTWRVHADIEPGTYRTRGRAGQDPCEYEIRPAEGATDGRLRMARPEGPATVVIKPRDEVFYTSGCMPWIKQ